MRLLVLFIFIFTASNSFGANKALKIEFVTSQIHGLYDFLSAISEQPHSSAEIRSVFTKSKYNNKQSQDLLKKFEGLQSSLRRDLDFEEYPKARHMGFDVEHLIVIQTAYATSLMDLKQRIVGLMSPAELDSLFEILVHFEPIYNELLWKPNLTELNKYRETYERKAVEWKANEAFLKALAFYRAEWPNELPFRVAFFPIPAGSRRSVAQSKGPMESVGIVMGETDIEGRFGVIFHEMAHSIYSSQSLKTQKDLEAFFANSNSRHKHLAKNYLNEIWATLIGNGWMYERIKGSLDKSSWYNDEIIEGVARDFYPVAKTYFTAGVGFDKEFIDAYIKSFEKKFPEKINHTETLLTYAHFATEGKGISADDVMNGLLKSSIRPRSIATTEPVLQPRTQEKFKNDGNTTHILVLTPSEVLALLAKRQEFPEMLEPLSKVPKNSTGLLRTWVDGKNWMVIVTNPRKDWEQLFTEIIKTYPVIKPDVWLTL